MVTAQRNVNARSWKEAARKASKGREIYEALQTELKGATGERIKEIISENAKLISSIPEKVSESVAREIAEYQQQGYRPEAIAEKIRSRVSKLTRSRIALIARTESSKAATALTRARAEDLNLPVYVWATSQDARVRSSHRKLNDVLILWSDPPSPEALIGERSTLGKYHAGDCPNCFPGDTIISSFSPIEKLWRAPYSGDLITIVTCGGTFSATPNHPILTTNGWVPVRHLDKSSNLVQIFDGGQPILEANKAKGKTTFRDLFEASTTKGYSRHILPSFDFHGDVINGDIDIVSFDQDLGKLLSDSEFIKSIDQPAVVAPEFMNCLPNGVPFGKESCCVLDKRVHLFSGHVYTLQSKFGWYGITPTNIVTQNCRCLPIPLVSIDTISFPARIYRHGQIYNITRSKFVDLMKSFQPA